MKIRRMIIDSVHNAYTTTLRKTTAPQFASYDRCPWFEEILELPVCRNFVFSQKEDVGIPPPPHVLIPELDRFIQRYLVEREKHLLSQLETVNEDYITERNADRPSNDAESITSVAKINLATSVFICPLCSANDDPAGRFHSRALIGRAALRCHGHCLPGSWPLPPDRNGTMKFSTTASPAGIVAARSVVHLLGLNEDVARVIDIDRLQARFLCNNCPLKPHTRKAMSGKPALKWRECVSLFSRAHDETGLRIAFVRSHIISACTLTVPTKYHRGRSSHKNYLHR